MDNGWVIETQQTTGAGICLDFAIDMSRQVMRIVQPATDQYVGLY
jgi:hypothetical protein